ncbi:tripartite tricarboxylate transporter substrate binding protein [Phytohabitans kaempferiae]|uniref:Tripartite tricarboxylate transporter substrate binding protein n=1 Tax=Phytohabitans kaempferiae TaxID=1620943 RepID=A0ABV6M9S4_9ACTN
MTTAISRRVVLAAGFGMAVAAAGCGTGRQDETSTADGYPRRPITLIVPFSAGGGTDLGARLLAADLEKELGGSIVVVNKDGAGSQTGLTEVAKARPDGYTIGAVNLPALDTIILSPDRKASFTIDSFDYLINHVSEPIIIAVKPDSPYRSLADLVAAVRARPDQIRTGTSGALTPEHLAQLQLERAASGRLRIAHFDGAAGSMAQFRGGRTDVAFTTPSFVEDLRALAVLTAERVQNLPDVPTAVEQGYADLVMVSSRGFAVPKGVPEPVLTKLRETFQRVAASPEHQRKAAEAKLTVEVIAGAEYADHVRRGHEEAAALVELARKRG